MNFEEKNKIVVNHIISSKEKVTYRKLIKLFPWFQTLLKKNMDGSLLNFYKYNSLNCPTRKKTVTLPPRFSRLTPKDIQIMTFLLEQRFATLFQLHFVFFRDKSLSTARSYLSKLSACGLLITYRSHPARPWAVSAFGVECLIKFLDDPESCSRLTCHLLIAPNGISATTNHDLLLTDVRVVLMNYFDSRFVSWFSKREIKQRFQCFGDIFKSGGGFLWPDAVLAYKNSKGSICHLWIKIDRRDKKSNYYYEHFKQHIYPHDDARFALNSFFCNMNNYLYITGPNCQKISLPLQGRKKILKDRGDYYIDEISDTDNHQDLETYCDLMSYYDNSESFHPFTSHDTFNYFHHLPLLFDPTLSKIKILFWDAVKRPKNEITLFRNNSEFRDLINSYDPVYSFLGQYGKNLSFDWMIKGLYQ